MMERGKIKQTIYSGVLRIVGYFIAVDYLNLL